MTLLCVEHVAGCTPLVPRKSCQAAQFLRGKLSKEDFDAFVRMMIGESAYAGEKFQKPVEDLGEMSMRTSTCLKNDQILTIGELVVRSEAEMLRMPNFGRKSLNELRELLTNHGLYFGMKID